MTIQPCAKSAGIFWYSLKPVGEFNSSRILVDGNQVEHWLNGTKVVENEFGSEELNNTYKESKFRNISDFQNKRKAHIVLQTIMMNHGLEI